MRNVIVIVVAATLALGAGVASYATIEREILPPGSSPLAVYSTNSMVRGTNGAIDLAATITATENKLNDLRTQKSAIDTVIANLENKRMNGSLTDSERDELGLSPTFGKPRGAYLTQTTLAQEIARTEKQLTELKDEQRAVAATEANGHSTGGVGSNGSAGGTSAGSNPVAEPGQDVGQDVDPDVDTPATSEDETTGVVTPVEPVTDGDDATDEPASGDEATQFTDSIALSLGVSLVAALLVLSLVLTQASVLLTAGIPTLAAFSLALVALQLTGNSLNLMTLAGLALGMSIALAETTFVGLLYADNPPAETLLKALRRVSATIGVATFGIFAIALAFTIWASPDAVVFAPLIYAFTATAVFAGIFSTTLTPIIAAWVTRRATEKALRQSVANGTAVATSQRTSFIDRILDAGIAFSLRNRVALITVVVVASVIALGVFLYLGRTLMFAMLAQYLDSSIATFTIVLLVILLIVAAIATGTFAGTAAAIVSILATLAAATAALFAAQLPLESSALTGLFTLLPATVLITMLFGKVANQRYYTREDRHTNILAAAQAMARPVLAIGVASAIAPLPFVFANFTGANVLFTPLAIAYVGGTLFATLVTIFIIPAVYETFCKVYPRRRRATNGNGATATIR